MVWCGREKKMQRRDRVELEVGGWFGSVEEKNGLQRRDPDCAVLNSRSFHRKVGRLVGWSVGRLVGWSKSRKKELLRRDPDCTVRQTFN